MGRESAARASSNRQCDGEKGSDKGARRGLAEEGDVWRPPRS